jgi:AcrR family transcriptional regulator
MARYQLENKEKNVLEAAEKVFLAKGYSGARTHDIAAEAGVTHAMLHYYFQTKEQLFERILKDKIAALAEVLIAISPDEDTTMKDFIIRVVSDHFDFLQKNPSLPRFVINVITEQPELASHYISFARDLPAQMIQRLKFKLEKEGIEMNPKMLLQDIIMLNVFSIIAMPVNLLYDPGLTEEEYIKQRKEENIIILLKRLGL